MKDKTRKLIQVILLLILLFNLYKIGAYYRAGGAYDRGVQKIQAQVQDQEKEDQSPNQSPDQKSIEKIQALEKTYPEIKAWIFLDQTEINYPVVQGRDNDYYLNHSYEKEVNPFGAIFMDYRNQADFSDQNTIIYGHNAKRGGCFKDLHQYEDPDFVSQAPYIEIDSLAGHKRYEIFAVYKADPRDPFRHTSYQGQDLENFRAYVQKRNILKRPLPEKLDHFITLQTCSPGDTRLVIQAVQAK